MNTQLIEARKFIELHLAKLSHREKIIIAGALIVAGTLLGYQVYETCNNAFMDQAKRLEQLEKDTDSAVAILARYATAKARKEMIEKAYKEVEIKEGALSHIETLVRDNAGIPAGQFNINEKPVRTYGENYEQAPFTVKFTTTNLSNLMSFLKEIVHGPKPLVLTRLSLTKSKASQSLDVDIDVSSMRQVK